jgi:hypothetical protein
MQSCFRSFLLLIMLLGFHPLHSKDRRSSAPFISGDTFREFADHIFDETTKSFDPTKVKDGDVIFLKTDYYNLEEFFQVYHPLITCKYLIITHNSDHSAPGPYYEMLDSPKIIAWFGQNVEGKGHPKLFNIPIGIANRYRRHGNIKIFHDYSAKRDNKDRPHLCYMNITVSNYPEERETVWHCLSDFSWCKNSQFKRLKPYLNDMVHSKFVVSPRGNGIDCHRTWEALLMGAIPIVRTSTLDPLYEGLPVLIIDDWECVTEEFLKDKYLELKNQTYNIERIFVDYWKGLVLSKYKKRAVL